MAYVQDVMREIADRVAPTSKNRQRIQDDSAAVTITGAANNGSGLIRITAAGHNFQTEQKVFIKGLTGSPGTTEANNTVGNPAWPVTRITSSTFDLQGSTFTNTYGSGGTAVGALVGTVDHANITRQRLLDVYNQTRFILAHLLVKQYPQSMVSELVPGTAKRKTDLTFASGSATKPSGLIAVVGLETAAAAPISVIPISQRKILKDLDSASNPLVMDYGQTFVAINGTTYVPNAATYVLDYIGLDTWTLSDVIFFSGTQTSETFNENWIPIIVEGCAALVAGRGIAEAENILGSMIDKIVE